MVQPVRRGSLYWTVGRPDVGSKEWIMQLRRSAFVAVGVMLGATVFAGCGGTTERPGASGTASRPEATASRTGSSSPDEPRRTTAPAGADETPAGEATTRSEPTRRSETTAAEANPPPVKTTKAEANPPPAKTTPAQGNGQGNPAPPAKTAPAEPSATATEERTPGSIAAASPTPTASTAPTEPTDSQTTWWPWLLLLVPIVGLIIWLLSRSSRRRDWEARYGVAVEQVRWVATSLAPSVANRTLPPEAGRQYWFEGRPRLDELQAELVALSTSAPDEALSATLARASASLTSLSQALETDVALRAAVVRTPENAAAL